MNRVKQTKTHTAGTYSAVFCGGWVWLCGKLLACCWVSGAARVLFPCDPGVSCLCACVHGWGGWGVVCENCIVDASIFIFCVCVL